MSDAGGLAPSWSLLPPGCKTLVTTRHPIFRSLVWALGALCIFSRCGQHPGEGFGRSWARESRRLAILPPSGDLPRSGGERNMQLLLARLPEHGFATHSVVKPGALQALMQRQGHASSLREHLLPAPGDVAALVPLAEALSACLPPQVPDDLNGLCLGIVQRLDDLTYEPYTEPRPVGDYDETDLRQRYVQALGQRLSAAGAGTGAGANMVRALQLVALRRALQAARPALVVADLAEDAVTSLLAVADAPIPVVWYVQGGVDAFREPFLRRHVHGIVSVSQSVHAERFAQHQHAYVAVNGIDTQKFHGRTPGARRPEVFAAAAPGDLIVVQSGALVPNKQQVLTLRAFIAVQLRVPNVQLYFFGNYVPDGGYPQRLRSLAAQAGIADRVHLVGYYPDMAGALPFADVAVLPSSAEAFGLALVEGMACEVASIGSNLSSAREIRGDDPGSVYLVDAQTGAVGDYEQALFDLLSDAHRRQDMGQRGRRRVVAHFDVASMLEQFASAMRQILGDSAQP